ncbi:RNA-editing complex protein MP100 [Trypanosoma theileri]|uniref:RNA-editing complex protein MP100 n=1 Tax=Trypanosoma theileri TaxID=67003 RepID=A0A1X0NSS8_9TRYP|nr:RNA-editing complex protein MP100 [Trypanosoma theileri]ORC87598.1 RNA-editing complex protein MP100 [Trypanosoma theileri]
MTLTKTPYRLAVTTYRQSKISDRFQLLITKKEVECDYVGVDATALVATGLRLAKNVTSEQRRHKEVARHVSQSLQQLLKKVRCKKSLLIAMDGAETLLKAEHTRGSSVTRKIESRLMRLPGTPLMQAVEERLVRMMPDRQILPSEVVFSGTCVQGCVEQKMSAWALDLASRDSFSGSTDSLCLIGASELYLNVMALSPFYNVMSVVQNNADLRQMRLQDILEWLDLDKRAKEGESVTIAKMRTDILFLFILANGASVTELHPIPSLGFSELVDRYLKNFMETTSNTETTEGGGKGKGREGSVSLHSGTVKEGLFLFEDYPGNTLRLNIPLLSRIIQLVARKEVPPRVDAASEAYLEQALQTHALLCLGEAPEYNYLPSMPTTQVGSPVAGVIPFAAHLAALCSSSPHRIARRTPPRVRQSSSTTCIKEEEKEEKGKKEKGEKEEGLRNETFELAEGGKVELVKSKTKEMQTGIIQPLTAAEYTILCQSLPASVETLIQHYVGVAPKSDVGKMITSSDTTGAHRVIREVLSYANPLKPHKCLCLSPSYCWLQNEKTQLWRFEYVDIGVRSHEMEIRRHLNAVKGVTLEVNMSRDGPSYFSTSTSSWEPIKDFPCGAERSSDDDNNNKQKETSSSSTTKGGKDTEDLTGSIKTEDDTKKDTKKIETLDKIKDNESSESKSTSSQISKTNTTDQNLSSKQSTLKLLTWNVMFDRYSGKPTPLGMPGIDWCSPKRYPILAKIIQQEDADVVGMQEVEPVFWNFLSKQSWVRENYFFSCGYASPAITPWGVLMLVHRRRLSIQNITYLNVPAWTNHVSLMPVVTLQMPHGSVNVAAAHLLAPYTKSHETARTSQDGALRHHMMKTLSGDVITMGDFNDWPTSEFHMPTESQYVDCWPLLHPGDAGKTMDETNTFCKLKVEEMFFGRSDKVFLRSRRLVPVEAHLVGTRSVNDENGNQEAPAYLFPSDHYGVSMTFKLKQR